MAELASACVCTWMATSWSKIVNSDAFLKGQQEAERAFVLFLTNILFGYRLVSPPWQSQAGREEAALASESYQALDGHQPLPQLSGALCLAHALWFPHAYAMAYSTDPTSWVWEFGNSAPLRRKGPKQCFTSATLYCIYIFTCSTLHVAELWLQFLQKPRQASWT